MRPARYKLHKPGNVAVTAMAERVPAIGKPVYDFSRSGRFYACRPSLGGKDRPALSSVHGHQDQAENQQIGEIKAVRV